MGDHPVRDWIYDWVVNLWMLWVVVIALAIGGVQWALGQPSPAKQPPALINGSDVDPSGVR